MLLPRTSKRKVRWVFDVVPATIGEITFIDPNTGERTIRTVIASHSALWVDANQNNGPKKLEIGNDDPANDPRGLYVRDFDLTTAHSNVGPNIRPGRYELKIGTTDIDNDLLSKIAREAWYQDPEYRSGISNKGRLNTCHSFIVRL